jgi:hypothetical protein
VASIIRMSHCLSANGSWLGAELAVAAVAAALMAARAVAAETPSA